MDPGSSEKHDIKPIAEVSNEKGVNLPQHSGCKTAGNRR